MNIQPHELEQLRHLEGEERQRFIDDLAKPRLMRLSPAEQAMQGFHWVKNDGTGDIGILFVGAAAEIEEASVYLVLNPDKPGEVEKWPVHDVLTTDLGKIDKPKQ